MIVIVLSTLLPFRGIGGSFLFYPHIHNNIGFAIHINTPGAVVNFDYQGFTAMNSVGSHRIQPVKAVNPNFSFTVGVFRIGAG